MSHTHWFAAIPTTYGRYGPQDVHYHACIEGDDCHRITVGPGHTCDGKPATHHRETLGREPWRMESDGRTFPPPSHQTPSAP